MIRSYTFPWSTLHVMNEYVDIVCIHEGKNNIPKENVPPPLPIHYPKIYPITVTGIIRHAKTSYFIIVFVDEVHA